VGSESLGEEGHDHLQFFPEQDHLALLLKKYFKVVKLKSHKYPISGGFLRQEAYWRCSNDEKIFENLTWKNY
jgi:hypothetical protein